jgi:hypothetical protein
VACEHAIRALQTTAEQTGWRRVPSDLPDGII